jgi:hypothetical protein
MEGVVLEMDWRSMLLALVVLADILVFADLVRGELREGRRSRRARALRLGLSSAHRL